MRAQQHRSANHFENRESNGEMNTSSNQRLTLVKEHENEINNASSHMTTRDELIVYDEKLQQERRRHLAE